MRLKKTIATLAVASIAALVATQWLSCAPRRPIDELARLVKQLPSVGSAVAPSLPSPSSAPSSAEPPAMAVAPIVEVPPALAVVSSLAPAESPAPLGPTVAAVLDTTSCSTDVVKKLSEQIIAEEACLRPNAFQKLPDTLMSTAIDDVVFPFLAPPAYEALLAALGDSRRERLTINSMLRTIAQQYLLFHWYKRGRCHIKLAAAPGRSNHQSGLALDIAQPNRWKVKLVRHGFRWMGAKDKWHFDFVGRDAKEKAQAKRISDAHAGLDVRAFQRLWNKNHPDESLGESGVFDERTEQALRRAPSAGFASQTTCGK